jgi:DNA repair exonuclease SbcCD ATPase subunit
LELVEKIKMPLTIQLENFRCHSNSSFNFPDSGLVQLAGESGAGKSTVLTGISYALYGKISGRIKKPYTHGKSTSKVTLEYRGAKIVRQAKPQRLCVRFNGVDYEDDAAQGIIDNNLMNMTYDEFVASSYIIQNQDISVLNMTPTNQLEFIKRLAFHDDDNEVTKNKIKSSMSEVSDDVKRISVQAEMIEANLVDLQSRFPTPVPTPSVITQGLKISTLRRTIDEISEKIKTITSEISRVNKDINFSRDAAKKAEAVIKEIEKLENERELLTTNLRNLQRELGTTKSETLLERKFVLRKLKSYLLAKRELEAEQQRYSELEKSHLKDISLRKEELRKDVLSEERYKEISEKIAASRLEIERLKGVQTILHDNDVVVGNLLKVCVQTGCPSAQELPAFLKSRLEECGGSNPVISLSTDEYGRRCKSCPSCGTKVAMFGERLYMCSTKTHEDDDTSLNISSIEVISGLMEFVISEMNKYDESVSGLSSKDIESQIKTLTDENTSLQKKLFRSDGCKEEIDKIDLMKSNSILESLKKKIQLQLSSLESLRVSDEEMKSVSDVVDVEADLEKLSLEIQAARTLESNISEITASIEERGVKLTTARRVFENSKNHSSVENISSLEVELERLTTSLSTTSSLKEEKLKLLDSLGEYEAYCKNQEECLKTRESLNAKISSLNHLRNRLTNLNALLGVHKDAEIAAVESTIASINVGAQSYLDRMFEDPIVVRLENTREIKNGDVKPQITVTIDYKGNRYESIEELSGGEKQRCELAFLLAINDMLGSRILMLDECLNNLDSNVNTDVLTYLRELSEGKLLLVVSHEAVKGVFDHEVEIFHQ